MNIHLRSANTLPEIERLKLLTDTGLNYLGALGRITSLLSMGKAQQIISRVDDQQRQDLISEYDSALFALGEIQVGLTEFTYDKVDELFIALTKSKS